VSGVQAGSELALAKVGAAIPAAASVLSVVQDWALGLLGVPIGVPLAAFSGVLYGLSYRDPMRSGRLWVNVGASTIFSSVLSPLGAFMVLRWFALPEIWQSAVMVGLAAVSGFATQYGHRWARTRRDRLLDRAADRILGPAPAREVKGKTKDDA